MARSIRYELGVGCLLAVALAVLAFLALQVGALSTLGDRVRVTVAFPDAAGLQAGAVVAVAGVEVGTVERLELDYDHAVVHMTLRPDAEVRSDARASIRSRSMLGEKYVALHPQSAEASLAKDGDQLEPAGMRVEIDDIVNALGPVMEALDPEAVSEALRTFSEALEEDPARLERMLHNADVILSNTAEASEELPGLAREARHTLADGRATLAEIDARAEEAREVIARAESVLVNVDEAAEGAPEVMAELESAIAEAREALARLESTSESLDQVMSNLAEIDRWELRRLIREEGVLIRLKKEKVEEPGAGIPEAGLGSDQGSR
jgi:phospholipid/cholesterol/gamma-HCH transport system substrate-binding protein